MVGVQLTDCAMMKEGPFPEHYEPFESPIANPLHPSVSANPAARVFKNDLEVFGRPDDYPYVATTYRLTEHFHYWSKHCRINAILQPEQFVEIGEALAREKGSSPASASRCAATAAGSRRSRW